MGSIRSDGRSISAQNSSRSLAVHGPVSPSDGLTANEVTGATPPAVVAG